MSSSSVLVPSFEFTREKRKLFSVVKESLFKLMYMVSGHGIYCNTFHIHDYKYSQHTCISKYMIINALLTQNGDFHKCHALYISFRTLLLLSQNDIILPDIYLRYFISIACRFGLCNSHAYILDCT